MTHLMFMDDLKIYRESPGELERGMRGVEEVSGALGMSLGLRKCCVAHMRKGKVVKRGSLRLRSGAAVEEIPSDGVYRYLGIAQTIKANIVRSKAPAKKEYFRRLNQVWRSSLNSGTARVAHNTWCVPVVKYLFGAVKWSRRELRGMDLRTRKCLRDLKVQHKNASVKRMYLPASEGGRGLLCLEQVWEREVVSVAAYLLQNEDTQVQGAMRLQRDRALNGKQCILFQAEEVLKRHSLPRTILGVEGTKRGKTAERAAKAVKKAQVEKMVAELVKMSKHGEHAKQLRVSATDKTLSCEWLREGALTTESEGTILAMQDLVTHTAEYRANILHEDVSPICSVCNKAPESVAHVLSACPVHSFGLYQLRHDKCLYHLVRALAEKLDLRITKGLLKPEGGFRSGVVGDGPVRILVNLPVPTRIKISERRPDVVV